jgi:hypothetical protein
MSDKEVLRTVISILLIMILSAILMIIFYPEFVIELIRAL